MLLFDRSKLRLGSPPRIACLQYRKLTFQELNLVLWGTAACRGHAVELCFNPQRHCAAQKERFTCRPQQLPVGSISDGEAAPCNRQLLHGRQLGKWQLQNLRRRWRCTCRRS